MGNAVDKHRKQLKKKELKKNKQRKEDQREFNLVKKDVRGVQSEITELEAKTDRTREDNERLGRLKAELARSVKAKEKYAEEHPEARHLLFPVAGGSGSHQRPNDDHHDDDDDDDDGKGLYRKDGKLRHPERSAYYDPVFNPYGVPPPGMPYKERERTPPESDSQDDDDEDDDDDIPMPEGPPPEAAEHDDSDETSSTDSSLADIPMPEGPPPPKVDQQRPKSFPQPFHYDPARRSAPVPAAASTYNQRPVAVSGAPVLSAGPVHFSGPPPQPPPPLLPTAATSTSNATPAPLAASAPKVAAGPAVISAAPQLRDLKKEATSFVPQAVKRKK